ncbi:DUF4112 domain-containing protein [Sphingoaurantiacus capsulatus]|uniref:DUF4112 domain-containing protein n=1 Tax=Sphingoaurantiacus capsulatus TaxID=1771310 RepID=A0ABV7XBM3_9SPHN
MAINQKSFDQVTGALSSLDRNPQAVRQRVVALEKVLERAFTVPGTQYKVGLDAIVGLVPVVGDWVTGAMSAYLIWEARNLGMSKWQLARMSGNAVFDTAVGMVPFAGDLFDFVFKSNSRNLRIIKAHLDKHHPSTVIIEGEKL